MKKAPLLVLAVLSVFSGAIHAQDSLLGKYSGSVDVGRTRNFLVGITVVIASVESGVAKGIGTRSGGPCSGDYQLEGTYQDNAVELKSGAKSGPAGDCRFAFTGTVDGDRLVGKLGTLDVSLRR